MQLLSLLFSPIKEFLKKGDIILLGLCLAASTFGLARNHRSLTPEAQAMETKIII